MRLALIAVAILLAFIVSSASASTTVSVVYFYPKDQAPVQASIDAIDPLVTDMRVWYGEHAEGYTFQADSVEVIEGERRLNRYLPDWWGLVIRELGYFCNTGVHLIILHDSIASNYAGGADCGIDGGGTAVVSEGLLDGHWPYAGVIPHELGHTFTLPHPEGCGESFIASPSRDYDGLPQPIEENFGSTAESASDHCNETVMWAQWLYPDVGLLESEVDILQTHPNFEFVTDFDGDGFTDADELVIGTDPYDDCGVDAWPVDFDNDTFVNSYDLSAVAGHIGEAVPPALARIDLDLDLFITSGDLSLVAARIGQGCTP